MTRPTPSAAATVGARPALAALAAVAVTAATAFAGTAVAQDTVRIGTEGAYAPWNYLDDDGQLAGYEIDLGNAVCERAGVTCEFVQNDWDSIIPNLQAGNYDVIMAGMSITDERKESIAFTADYYPPDPSRYMAKAGMDFDFDDLNGVRIGAQGSTIQAAYAEASLAEGNTILTYEAPDQSIADLMAGNLDIIIADGTYLREQAAGIGDAVELVGPEVMIGGGVGAGLRQDDAELQAAIDEALAALKADGTVDALIQEYFQAGPFYAD